MAAATSGSPSALFDLKSAALTAMALVLKSTDLMALATNDVASAIPLAELAVERSPQDAGFRALLADDDPDQEAHQSDDAECRDADDFETVLQVPNARANLMAGFTTVRNLGDERGNAAYTGIDPYFDVTIEGTVSGSTGGTVAHEAPDYLTFFRA